MMASDKDTKSHLSKQSRKSSSSFFMIGPTAPIQTRIRINTLVEANTPDKFDTMSINDFPSPNTIVNMRRARPGRLYSQVDNQL